MGQKVYAAIEALKAQGHNVRPYNREGTFWFEIDGRMVATWQEMEQLADRISSRSGLEDLFVRQRKEEQSN